MTKNLYAALVFLLALLLASSALLFPAQATRVYHHVYQAAKDSLTCCIE